MAKTTKINEVKLATKPRRLKTPTYKRLRYSKRIKHPGPKMASSWRIMRQALGVIWRNKKLFLILLTVYVVLSLIFVKGFTSTVGLNQAKANLSAQGYNSSLSTGAVLVSSLFNSRGGAISQAASTYQTILLVIMSLVIIWVLRQLYAANRKTKVSAKAGFYNGVYPLVPFLLVILLISFQLIPFLVGSAIYTTIIGNGLAVTAPERLVWGSMLFILAVWSLYMLSASLFAIYIVTLPDVKPFQAMRSARQLVKYRRWTVMRKLIFLPVSLLIILSLVMLPIVLWLTPAAEWIFFVLGLALLSVVHSYMYRLYRELL
ncbi:MAG: hypothetical protein ABIQ89_04115 [Candidatus Saccharimonadales bacterium]